MMHSNVFKSLVVLEHHKYLRTLDTEFPREVRAQCSVTAICHHNFTHCPEQE